EVRDLTLLRARRCYDEVRGWKSDLRAEATQRAKGLPVAVRMQGLMVVLASLTRKEHPADRRLATALAQWLGTSRGLLGEAEPESFGPIQLLDACRRASRSELLGVEWEAILFFEQIKLYADALSATEDRK